MNKLMIATLASVVAADENVKMKAWMSPNALTGIMIFLLMVMFFIFGVFALNNVTTPAYQLPANNEKNKDSNREWSNIWGNIERN